MQTKTIPTVAASAQIIRATFVLMSVLAAGSLSAQEAAPAKTSAPPAILPEASKTAAAAIGDVAKTNAEPAKMKSVVVTGSLIPTAATETATPLFSIDRAQIERTPVRNTSELLRRLPEANGGGVSEIGNGTGFETGASGVSLRGFGAEATLVLINGRRVTTYGDGQNGTDSFVDLNSIPLSVIDRIEVVKDGASALYGADAVAGVVNILTRQHYRGGEMTFGYGNTTHRDMGEINANAVFGTGNDNTDVYVSFNYLKRNALFNRDRGYSAITDRTGLGGINTGSRNSNPGVFRIPRSVAEGLPGVTVSANSNLWNNAGVIPQRGYDPRYSDPNDPFYDTVAVSGGKNINWSGGPGSVPASAFYYGFDRGDLQDRNPLVPQFNFNKFSSQVPSTERVGFGSEFEQKLLGENMKFFVELMYQNVQTRETLAPGPISSFESDFATPIVIPASNPWNPFGVDISGSSSFRPLEFGGRITDIVTDWLRLVTGLRGSIGEWNYDTAFLLNQSDTSKKSRYISASGFNSILDPANTGVNLPYNPFVGPAGLPNNSIYANQVAITTEDKTFTRLMGADFKLNNPSIFQIPMGDIGFATGVEWRREELEAKPDPLASSNDVVGQSQLDAYKANRDVGAWYGEVRIPLLSPDSHVPLINEFTVNIAGRVEQYSDVGFTGVPKVSFQWYPFDKQFMLRGSWSRGFKSPSLFELYNPGNYALQIVDNPYNSEKGVEADIASVGNPNLKPEDSESFSTGFVLSPDFFKGFTLHADFWQTERTGVVDSADFQTLLNRAHAYSSDPLQANNAFAASENVYLDLNADGSINFLVAPFDNTATATAQGVDFGVDYVITTKNCGRFTWGVNATYLHSFIAQQNTSQPPGELAGHAYADASDAIMQWRGNSSLWWEYKRLAIGVTGTFIGPYKDSTESLGFSRNVDAYATMDIEAQVQLPLGFSCTVGCNNVLNEKPPLTLTPASSAAEGYIPSVYSPVQQFVYFSVTKKF